MIYVTLFSESRISTHPASPHSNGDVLKREDSTRYWSLYLSILGVGSKIEVMAELREVI